MLGRTIKALHLGDGESFTIGGTVARIEEYTENGSLAAVPYLHVHFTDGKVFEVCKHATEGVLYGAD